MSRVRDPLAALIPTMLFVGWSAWAITAGVLHQWGACVLAGVGAILAGLTLAVLNREP